MNRRIKNYNNSSSATKKGRGKSRDRQHLNRKEILFDKINIQILREIIKDSNVKSSEISANIDVPISTIQRRRRHLEDSTMLEKKFEINTKKIGLRTADLMIKVSKGEIGNVASHIVNETF